MNDPMSKALEQSLAEACDAVGMRPDDEACPDCYIAGSVEAFRRQHEADREELAALRAEVAQLRQEQDAERRLHLEDDCILLDATIRLAALTAALEGLIVDYEQLIGDGVIVDTEPLVLTVARAVLLTPEAEK